MAYVDTRIGRLSYHEVGAGPPVLLWHSFLSDHTIWSSQVDKLKGTYRVVLIDGPGHGASACPPETFALEDCVPATLAVLDAAGVERTAVAGISWGGLVAMQLALTVPERVTGLALLSTSADAESLTSRIQNGVLARVARRFGVLKLLEPFVLSSLFSAGFLRRQPQTCEAVLRGIRAADRTAFFRVMTAIIRRASLIDDIRNIRVPTLVITGTADRIQRPDRGERIAQRIPGARFVRLEGCGHLSTLERPDDVSRLLQEFLPAATGSDAKVNMR